MTPRKPNLLDPSYLRSIGMFESANLTAAGDCYWSRGSLEQRAYEFHDKWPCEDCWHPKADCVCHERSDT